MNRYVFVLVLLLSNTLAWTQEPIRVYSTNPEPKGLSACLFEFELPKALPSSATLEIICPGTMVLDPVMLASSKTITGGLVVAVSSDTITVKRVGLGGTVAAGTEVDLRVASIIFSSKQEQPEMFIIRGLDNENPLFRLESKTEIRAWSRNEG